MFKTFMVSQICAVTLFLDYLLKCMEEYHYAISKSKEDNFTMICCDFNHVYSYFLDMNYFIQMTKLGDMWPHKKGLGPE